MVPRQSKDGRLEGWREVRRAEHSVWRFRVSPHWKNVQRSSHDNPYGASCVKGSMVVASETTSQRMEGRDRVSGMWNDGSYRLSLGRPRELGWHDAGAAGKANGGEAIGM